MPKQVEWTIKSSDFSMKVSVKDANKALKYLAEYMLKVDGSVPGDEGVSARAKFLAWQIRMPAAEQAKLYKLYTKEEYMGLAHKAWPKIGKLSDVAPACRRAGLSVPEFYRGKIKLHGTNACLAVNSDGEVLSVQSRTRVITPLSDNAGFAEWVYSQRWTGNSEGIVYIFGEWCGPGVQASCSCNQTSQKVFYVFAVVVARTDEIVIEPYEVSAFVPANNPRIKILPWHTEVVKTEDLASFNEEVEAIGKNDPYIKALFGIEGQGEGLVFYPVKEGGLYLLDYFDLCAFKAKASGFRENGGSAIGKAPVSSKDAQAFAETYVSALRMEGIIHRMELGEARPKDKTGEFVKAVCADVEEETRNEREASGFEWKNVKGQVSALAAAWYLK